MKVQWALAEDQGERGSKHGADEHRPGDFDLQSNLITFAVIVEAAGTINRAIEL